MKDKGLVLASILAWSIIAVAVLSMLFKSGDTAMIPIAVVGVGLMGLMSVVMAYWTSDKDE